MTTMTMKGKRVLVTGSGIGIGRGIALAFARQGADVAFHFVHETVTVESAVEEVRSNGGKARAFAADFTDLTQTQRLARDAIDFLGGIDVLINNSGITMNRPFEQITPEQYETLYQVNVRAMFFVTQTAVPTMSEQGGGVVINIASVHAFQGLHEHSIYAGTKGAVVAFSRALAVELGPKHIRVNSIAPGPIVVEKHAQFDPPFDADKMARGLPVGRVGNVEDVARLALFLASDQASFMTGQTYVIDGGQTAVMAQSEAFRTPLPRRLGRQYVDNP